jgi:hypothetical protein
MQARPFTRDHEYQVRIELWNDSPGAADWAGITLLGPEVLDEGLASGLRLKEPCSSGASTRLIKEDHESLGDISVSKITQCASSVDESAARTGETSVPRCPEFADKAAKTVAAVGILRTPVSEG